MKQIYLLNNSSNIKEFEEEEKNKFLQVILEQLDINVSNLFNSKSVENKIKIKEILSKYNIQIVNEEDFSIFVDNKMIANIKKPFVKIKKDPSILDRKKNLYLEVHVEYWSIFDEDVK